MNENKTRQITKNENNSDKQYLIKRFTAAYLDLSIETLGIFLLVIPGLGYTCLKDAFFEGRSIGKKIIGLQVVNYESGKPCSYKESILRNMIMITPIAWIECFMVLLQSEKRRLGDLLANTKVVDDTEFDIKRIAGVAIISTVLWSIILMAMFIIEGILIVQFMRTSTCC